DQRLAVADLDGDGVRDLVFLTMAADGSPVLRALSGRDGRLLWERPLRADHPQGINIHAVSFAAADLDGDGKAEVVLALAGKGEVVILNGADGRPRATASGLTVDIFGNLWHTGVSPLHLIQRAGGGRAVCVSGRRHEWQDGAPRVTLRLTL